MTESTATFQEFSFKILKNFAHSASYRISFSVSFYRGTSQKKFITKYNIHDLKIFFVLSGFFAQKFKQKPICKNYRTLQHFSYSPKEFSYFGEFSYCLENFLEKTHEINHTFFLSSSVNKRCHKFFNGLK